MIISNLSVPLLGLADTAILGHLDSAHYLAAVAVGSSVLSFLYWGFGFLRMGTTGFAAQAFGAADHQASRQLMAQSLIMGAGIGFTILLASPWLLKLGLYLVEAPESAQAAALSYSQIRIFSAPAVLINYGIIGWLIGHHNTRGPLYIMVFTNCLNILLDVILVIGLDMGSDGAAWATLVAEYSGCGLALYMLSHHLKPMGCKVHWPKLMRWQSYHSLLKINQHLFIRTLALLASFAFFTAQGANQGETILAANAILMQLVLLASFGMDGFTHASEALIGEAIGQKNHHTFLSNCYACGRWALLMGIIFSSSFYLFGNPLLALFSSIPEVVNTARIYLPWVIALPLLAMASYWLDGIFIGATQSKAMQYSMLFSSVFIYLPCWYLTQHWNNHGLWLAFTAFNVARGISLGFYFFRYNKTQFWYT
ncbi:MAG: MATE family multidrug resistance protein [Pseudohongiellaceae bacterium]|jgi:MATE family multidrug resistance protein